MSNFKSSSNTARKTLLQSALVAAFAVAAFAPVTGIAQSKGDSGHWYNSGGNVWKNSNGLCWRTSAWTPANASAECDPELMAKADVPAPKMAETPPPAPVAAAPAPAPAPAPVPTTRVETRKVALSSEELFDFNKSALRPAGKEKLDQLAEELRNVENEKILVTGHTDRLGSQKYNQKLSEQRAASVNAYLISKGVKESQTTSRGMGETQPVTQAGDCKGQASKKVIACLQPDRRVEVDVSATNEVTVTK